MTHALSLLLCLTLTAAASAAEFRHFGNFLLKSHFKVTGDRITPIPMKPIVFRVATDGMRLRITAEGDDEAHTSFEIYRSDGIGRQRAGTADLDVIPGVQAMSTGGGVLRHVRLTRETLTITTFPGLSDQTIVSHAVATELTAAPPTTPKPPPPAPKRPAKP
jgi:hypothetical protein